MKRTIYFLGSLALVATALTAPAYADTPAGSPPESEEISAQIAIDDEQAPDLRISVRTEEGEQYRHGMSLTDEQLEKMNTLKLQFMESTAGPRAQLHVFHRQLRDMMTKPNVDRAQATSLQDKINGLRAQLSTSQLNLRLDMHAVLTPEQQQELRHRMLKQAVFGHHRFVHTGGCGHGGGGHGGGGGECGHGGGGGGFGPGGEHGHRGGSEHSRHHGAHEESSRSAPTRSS